VVVVVVCGGAVVAVVCAGAVVAVAGAVVAVVSGATVVAVVSAGAVAGAVVGVVDCVTGWNVPSVVGVVVSANAAPTGVCAATPNSNTSSARRAQLFFKTRPMIAPSRVQKRSVLDPLPTVLSGMCEIEG